VLVCHYNRSTLNAGDIMIDTFNREQSSFFLFTLTRRCIGGVGKLLALFVFAGLLVATAQAAENFWQLPASQTQTRQSDHSLIGNDDFSASLFTSKQIDLEGRFTEQSAISLTQNLSDTSSLNFEYADARDERNFMFGYTNNNLSVSVMNGSGEDYSRLGGNYTDLDPYLFHGGVDQNFSTNGYALDYNFGRFGHMQFGQATVKADNLLNRRARYFEWSNSKIFARATQFTRGRDNIGSGLDIGYAFGAQQNKLLALQSMQLDHGRSMQRIRFQFNGKKNRQYWFDVAAHHNPLFESNDDYRLMFSFKTVLGSGFASYQNDEVSTSGEGSSEEDAMQDESGSESSGKKKKSGKGWKRAVFIGLGVGAAASLSSSGSEPQDTNNRAQKQNDAAFDVLNAVNPQSVRVNKEFGGWIFINPDGSFSSTTPVRGDFKSVQLPNPSEVIPNGSNITAAYHTHAAFDPKFDNENFSPTDLDLDRENNIDGYLGTPGGQLKFHDITDDSITTVAQIATE
jgi:hypothetical protein